MPHSEKTLAGLCRQARKKARQLLEDNGLDKSMAINSIILYGSAAKYQLRRRKAFRDWDLNVFLRRRPTARYRTGAVRTLNPRGHPWCGGKYQGKKLDILFNLLGKEETWQEYVKLGRSKRWPSMRKAPILLLHPDRQDLRNLK